MTLTRGFFFLFSLTDGRSGAVVKNRFLSGRGAAKMVPVPVMSTEQITDGDMLFDAT